MPMQKLVRLNPVDFMWPIEELDLRSVRQAEFGIVPTNLGVLPSHPFVGGDTIVMASLDHKWPGSHQVRQFGIVRDMAHIPLEDLVLSGEDIAVAIVNRGIFNHPLVEIGRADRKTVVLDEGGDPYRRFSAVGQPVERDPCRVNIW